MVRLPEDPGKKRTKKTVEIDGTVWETTRAPPVWHVWESSE